MGGEHDLGGAEKAGLLARGERGGRVGEGRARLDLDEGERSLLLGDDVDLAGGGAQPAGADGPSGGLEGGGGAGFGADAAGGGVAAAAAADFFPSVVLIGAGHAPVIDAPEAGGTRALPPTMGERLIVALDLPEIGAAEAMADRLAGVVSFFKIGLWLAFARGVDGLIERLIAGGNRVFLDAKMHGIM
jgi:Orotidine 5'-phosphate decarboxylase / HUMPS family